ncbi:hypothetical protein BACCAP_00022 [Pseudoflavonifractor capillosus ATCC 29799]|uniref:Uncharacterized protein n=1 Tax=Pseudoflavonifractor capillosus ATCC 29799 TaxID=411467 RepID=A6NP90_9FIRM|nr:hypothetical protein BACCAP_00022 [Pseudoflavonifractor capillosus ATCC 29799]
MHLQIKRYICCCVDKGDDLFADIVDDFGLQFDKFTFSIMILVKT